MRDMISGKSSTALGALLLVCGLALCLVLPLVGAAPAPQSANVQPRPVGVIVDTPAIAIAGQSAQSTATPSTSAHEAQVIWTFGTVSGSCGTCTVQAQTTYDGATWLTLGSAASVTVSSGAVNAWTIIAQAPTSSGVTAGDVSATAALGFGLYTQFAFACSSYGANAPVSISVIYR
ncbi:MAG: hypothetical protein ABSF46_22135 [Terriglobia bacterium]